MNVLWLQSAGCGGCTMSLLCAENPNVLDTLGDGGIEFLWHPSLSIETGAEVVALLSAVERGEIPLDVLCVEGSVATGPRGTGRYHMLAGTGRAMLDWLRALAPRAEHVVAVGTCAERTTPSAMSSRTSRSPSTRLNGPTRSCRPLICAP